MRLKGRFAFLIPAAVLLIAAFSAFGQPRQPDFNRAQTFDTQNYILRASFDRANNKEFGDTTASLKPLKADFRFVEIDAVDFYTVLVTFELSGVPMNTTTLPANVG